MPSEDKSYVLVRVNGEVVLAERAIALKLEELRLRLEDALAELALLANAQGLVEIQERQARARAFLDRLDDTVDLETPDDLTRVVPLFPPEG